MKVKRIVANVSAQQIDAANRFYGEVLGLDILMDHGWITSYGNTEKNARANRFRNGRRIWN